MLAYLAFIPIFAPAISNQQSYEILAELKTKGLVAQLNSALDYGSRGYWFESSRGHLRRQLSYSCLFFYTQTCKFFKPLQPNIYGSIISQGILSLFEINRPKVSLLEI